MSSDEMEYGIEIDARKFLAWSKGRKLDDVGGLIRLIVDAVESNDEKFLRQFPFIGRSIQRKKEPA